MNDHSDFPDRQVRLASVLNHLSSILNGCWGADADGLRRHIYCEPMADNQPYTGEILIRHLQQDMSLAVLQQLTHEYFIKPASGVETLNLCAIADLIIFGIDNETGKRNKVRESNRKSLGSRILPALSQAKFIDGYESGKTRGASEAHKINVSAKGINLMLWHYGNVNELTSPLLEEWCSIHSEGN